ncbi:TrbI/VirB10 family protein [Anaeromyxobacter diazotrophicus]|uniref:Conjugal transfer protein TrbI n=1 Tax=Anaeromyxobacter diazotrophicus TaxID=2590199 RepID=A0A7I9VKY6_9BACT|nr:TrbI/VirB10 family protein [Anaeromyxobacter diazotrophicus]GEJ56657.1 conjugal transfer protein TrbI [Anaeromyxobacter diazotrophicus]
MIRDDDGPERSPILLAPPAAGRRLNRVPLAIAMAFLTAVMGVIGYTVHARAEAAQRRAESRERGETEAAEAASAEDALRDIPDNVRAVLDQKSAGATRPQSRVIVPDLPLVETEERALPREDATARDERLRRETARQSALEAALNAPTTIPIGPAHERRLSARDEAASTEYAAERVARASAARPRVEERRDPYLAATRERAVSPYELKEGAVIPAVMIGGVNSDLPGQLLAQVRENVWDTATGAHLLVPQGAKLVGSYDSRVAVGQERVLVTWHRLVFPDGSTLALGRMPGADGEGYAGFHDQVNNHYLKAFGGALLLSVFGAGAQLSQPRPSPGEVITPGQIAAAQLGQQFSALGTELARRNLQVQPTLEIRPGYRFNVFVTKDIVLEPWTE